MIISRQMELALKEAAKVYSVISVVGPRQAGKTTLIQSVFKTHTYISLEDPDIRNFASTDPKKFLEKYSRQVIFDEIQRVPSLFSYIQSVVDRDQEPGQFILSGSQNFLLIESVSQSLAGRVALFKLLPFSLLEIKNYDTSLNLEKTLFKGLFPPLYKRPYSSSEWYRDYIETYLERDVRLIKHVSNLSIFKKFLILCALRNGQLVNFTSLARDCGISHNTARDWMTILEASYIIYLLKPYTTKVSDRVQKSPKLYFVDTGLLSALLGITSEHALLLHPSRGSFFETLMITEFLKYAFHTRKQFEGYFWRDREGHEVDLIINLSVPIAIEFKASTTLHSDDFRHLHYFGTRSDTPVTHRYVIYGGTESYERSAGQVLSWTHLDAFLPQTVA